MATHFAPQSKPLPETSSTIPATPSPDVPPFTAISTSTATATVPTTSAPLAAASAAATTVSSFATVPTAASTLAATSISPATVAPRPPEPDADVIHIPSYSRWFSWNGIHECEARFVPEFFDGRSQSKNPRVYKYYRNSIIRRFRENPNRKITFTDVRKTIVGDVGSIRRVFDFLEAWGLINYTGSTQKPQLKWDEKEAKSAAAAAQSGDGTDVALQKKRVCSGCKTICTIACFASDKHDMTLCARCYVRGNYRVGLSSSDFKRVEITDEAKTDWTDKETLQLLEAILHYGDDWKKVAEHVGGRSVKECVARFVKLPFGEQFAGPPESGELDAELGMQNATIPTKKMRLSPLADASNPIMGQAAFLSTLAGVDVAEVAARAAITALSNFGDMKQQVMNAESDDAPNGTNPSAMEETLAEAKLELEKEEDELEKAISGIAAQTKELEDKIRNFEELDLQVEKRQQHFQQLQDRLFLDQLTLLFHKNGAPKPAETIGEAIKIE